MGLAILLAGCDAPDPIRGRLAPGAAAMAVAVDPAEAAVTIDGPEGTGLMGLGWYRVPVGTAVRVVADDQADVPPDPAWPASDRRVKVLIREGEWAGMVGTITRNQLRPVPAD